MALLLSFAVLNFRDLATDF